MVKERIKLKEAQEKIRTVSISRLHGVDFQCKLGLPLCFKGKKVRVVIA